MFSGEEFCKSLRLKIWSAALGTLDGLDLCPSKDEFFLNHWIKIATSNSAALWEAFHHLPHDSVKVRNIFISRFSALSKRSF